MLYNRNNTINTQITSTTALDFKIWAFFGPGTGEVVLNEVTCVGNEDRILDCQNNGVGNRACIHAKDAGVVCERECIN